MISKVKTKSGLKYQVRIRKVLFPRDITRRFEKKQDAERWEQSVLSQIQRLRDRAAFEGLDFRNLFDEFYRRLMSFDGDGGGVTVGDMIDRFLATEMRGKKPSWVKELVSHLTWWKDQIGHHRLSAVRKSLILEQRAKLEAPKPDGSLRAPGTVNRYVTSLSAAISAAVEWEWVEYNICHKISRRKEPRSRDRFLSSDEQKRILAACDNRPGCPSLKTIVLLAMSTGPRLSEIGRLRRRDVDLDRGTVTYRGAKTDEWRTVPLEGSALSMMRTHMSIPRVDTDLVFPGIVDPKKPLVFRTAWLRTLREANIIDFRFHDLRHTAGAYLAMHGCSARQIAEILGHKTLAMVMRYTHFAADSLRDSVRGMNEAFIQSCHNGPQPTPETGSRR